MNTKIRAMTSKDKEAVIEMMRTFYNSPAVLSNGSEEIYASDNPLGLLRSNLLKVYVDLAKPNRYYVETDAILPGNAVLHKFNYDTDGNARRLMEGLGLE